MRIESFVTATYYLQSGRKMSYSNSHFLLDAAAWVLASIPSGEEGSGACFENPETEDALVHVQCLANHISL